MRRFSRTLGLLCISIATLQCLAATQLWAQDATATPTRDDAPAEPKPEEQLADQAAQKVEEAKGTFMRAIKGDTGAIQELATQYLVPAAIALAMLFVGYLIASFIGRIVGNLVTKNVDVTLGRFIGKMVKMVKNLIMLLVILGVLGTYGVNVTSFAAILAAAGFAFGMALQGTLGNFAAGIMLLIFRPFKVGDYIIVDGTEGTVHEIDLFSTKLNSLDNRHLIVPNGTLFGSTIENVTHNEYRRVDVNVGADYPADIDHTRQVLSGAVSGIPGALADPAPEIYLCELGASSVDWQVRVWCNPANYWGVREATTVATKKALDKAGIGIPYPQLDLHVVSGSVN